MVERTAQEFQPPGDGMDVGVDESGGDEPPTSIDYFGATTSPRSEVVADVDDPAGLHRHPSQTRFGGAVEDVPVDENQVGGGSHRRIMVACT
jgi:hypothetical protein